MLRFGLRTQVDHYPGAPSRAAQHQGARVDGRYELNSGRLPRRRRPTEPPRVMPAMPVVLTTPPGGCETEDLRLAVEARPRARLPARVRSGAAGQRGCPHRRQSMTRPSSHTARPATPRPPARTAIGRPYSRATATARTTSATPVQRRDQAGALVNQAIPDAACGVVGGVPGCSTVPRAGAELLNRIAGQGSRRAAHYRTCRVPHNYCLMA